MSAPVGKKKKKNRRRTRPPKRKKNETKRKEERNEESFSAHHSAGLDARDGCRRIRIRAGQTERICLCLRL